MKFEQISIGEHRSGISAYRSSKATVVAASLTVLVSLHLYILYRKDVRKYSKNSCFEMSVEGRVVKEVAVNRLVASLLSSFDVYGSKPLH